MKRRSFLKNAAFLTAAATAAPVLTRCGRKETGKGTEENPQKKTEMP